MSKTKRQLRAEIVERWNKVLENPDLNPLSRISISWFVDLLTDDETCKIKQHRCTACDHEINDDAYFVRIDLDNGCWTTESKTANFCPCCGRMVEQ